jgi:hypothetical protein
VLAGEDQPKVNDGALCSQDDDCTSGFCTTAQLCAPSACNCPGDACGPQGKRSSACADGWVCVDAKSLFDPVREFFGGKPPKDRGYCQPLCSQTCPEHYTCSGGTFCAPEQDWANPVPSVSWSGAVTGNSMLDSTTIQVEQHATVYLKASATSPTDEAIASFQWNVVDDSGAQVTSMGPELELQVDGSYKRADLTVTDARNRSTMLSVTFDSCSGTGVTCGYQGSGCCQSCDATTNLCL